MADSASNSAKEGPNFVAFVKEQSSSDAALAVASNHGWSESCVHYGDVRQAIVYLSEKPCPKTLLVEIPSAEAAPELLDRLAEVCKPSMQVIVSGTVDEFSFYSWLKTIGIEHYLLQPFDGKALQKIIGTRADQQAQEAQQNEGKIIAMMGARGGVGTTTLAANISYLLAHHYNQKTAFVDLDPYFGSAAMAFDLTPTHGLRDAMEKPDRIDTLFLDKVMMKQSENLSILGAEEEFKEIISTGASASVGLLREVRKKFQFVIVDLPRAATPLTRSVLAQADHIVLVSELSLLSLRDALRLHDYITGSLESETPILVANREGVSPKYELKKASFEKHYGRAINCHIPYMEEAFAAASEGDMLVNKTQNNKALDSLHALISNFTDIEPTTPKPASGGMLSKLLGKND